MTQLTDKGHWCVEVPDDANDFEIQRYKVRNAIDERDEQMLVWASLRATHNFLILSRGSWQYLFTTKEATWGEAEMVVEKINGWFKDYGGNVHFSNPVDSLQSLLISKGCDVNKNYAIIQKQNDNGTEKKYMGRYSKGS